MVYPAAAQMLHAAINSESIKMTVMVKHKDQMQLVLFVLKNNT